MTVLRLRSCLAGHSVRSMVAYRTQLLVSVTRWAPLAAVEVIIGAVVVARALASLGSDLSAWQIVVFICAVIMSVSILYSLTTSKSM